MVAEARTWVDVESAVREWARDRVASAERRVFFGANVSAPVPQIVLFRIAGPDDRCLIQFDVWGDSKAQAAATAAELATAADEVGRYTHDGVILHGAVVDSVRWQPDDESDQPRYVVDVMFTATGDRAQ
ncbi:MAG: hypothetical protein AB7L91_06285 [Dehalococcoidia bacterium]